MRLVCVRARGEGNDVNTQRAPQQDEEKKTYGNGGHHRDPAFIDESGGVSQENIVERTKSSG
jgi:hypothetical protein